jgi:hypothetical protein
LLNTTAQSQSRAAEYARQLIAQEPVFLDTETTGLGKDSEIVEFSLIDKDGNLLFDSLVRPSRPIPMEVIRIHHINDQMVSSAPSWPAVWARMRHLLIGRKIGIYNAEFDLRMMQQSINTMFTVLITVICLIALGTRDIINFNLAMLFGLISGAYSTIFIAPPLVYEMEKKNKEQAPAKKKEKKKNELDEIEIKGINS